MDSLVRLAIISDLARGLVTVEAILGGLGDVRAGIETGSQFAETLSEHGSCVTRSDFGRRRVPRREVVGNDGFVFHWEIPEGRKWRMASDKGIRCRHLPLVP